MAIKIERLHPRPGGQEEPVLTAKGYELAAPGLGKNRNKADNATYVRSLDDAAGLIAKGYSIRMGRRGLRPSLISPKSLRITRY